MSDGSLFAETGRIAARAAQRELLLATLKRERWNLSRAARALGLCTPAVSRAVAALGLTEELETARANGAANNKGGRPRRIPAANGPKAR